jgi:arylsulfatase A-like enzyme
MRLMRKLIAIGCSVLLCHQAVAAGKASHVVLIVWDGMRPDFVSKENTPTLFEMSRHGVTFLHHHPVYVSSTEVNGTALATGVYPAQSTIIANDEFRPSIDPREPIEIQSLAVVRKGDVLSHDHYLAYPTVSEILHENGLRTVVAGTKPIALLHDRAARGEGALDVTLFAGQTLPADVKEKLVAACGPFPSAGATKTNADQWTTSALISQLWKDGVPPFSLLWLAEPDYSQHKDGPGAPGPMLAIKNCDDALARVLQALKEKNAADSTDVIVVSDHGFSTVLQVINVAETLKKAGLRVFDKFPSDNPAPGDIMVVSDGGVVLCYVTGHEVHQTEEAVHCLQAQPYTGVIFTKKAIAGTFPLAEAHMDSPYAPDIVVVLRWKPDASKYGVPGMIYCDRAYDIPNKGSHSTLSPTEMHNTGVAFGPDFVSGMSDTMPTGNIDIAPTILWILGVQPKQKMSGRVLSEALNASAPPVGAVESHHEEATWQGDGFIWRQYLDISEVNGVTYLDQGNGSQETVQSAGK